MIVLSYRIGARNNEINASTPPWYIGREIRPRNSISKAETCETLCIRLKRERGGHAADVETLDGGRADERQYPSMHCRFSEHLTASRAVSLVEHETRS